MNVADPTLERHLNTEGQCFVDNVLTDNTITDGAFHSSSALNDVLQGGRSSVEGQYCIVRGCSGPNCVTFFTQNRTVNVINLRVISPAGGNGVYFPLQNKAGYQQVIDSSIAGTTTGPKAWAVSTEGLYTFRWWVTTLSTNCFILPTVHPAQVRNVNVMGCRPEWNISMNNGTNVHPESGAVTVSLFGGYGGLQAPADAAAKAWAAALGKTITVTTADCSGPRCIKFGTYTKSTGCAEMAGSSVNSVGEWQGTAGAFPICTD